jgi:hypothetical protein
MKNKLSLVLVWAASVLAVLLFAACPMDSANSAGGAISPPADRAEHLAMLRSLGVNTDPDLPVAPNGQSYNPQTSSEGRAVTGQAVSLGPVGKIFSRPKREIFVAGYSTINDKNHALYEDFSDLSSLKVIGQDSKNDTGWADGSSENVRLPRKSVAADLDGDGIDEVVIVTMVGKTDKILVNKGEYKNGAFTVTQAREFNAPGSVNGVFADDRLLAYWTLIAADLNGDNKKECIFTFPKQEGEGKGRAYIYILDNDLDVRELDITPYLGDHLATDAWHPMITAADYDQDGKDEICLILGAGSSRFTAPYVILDDKDAGYRELGKGYVTNSTNGISQGNVVAADFTGDGLPDTVFYGDINSRDGNVSILLKTTLDAGFNPVFTVVDSVNTTRPNRDYCHIPRLAAGDVDGDGSTELYFDNLLWRYNGSQFEELDGGHLFNLEYWDRYDVVIGDITGDRKDDVVRFAGHGNLEIFYYDSGAYKMVRKNISGKSYYETGCLPNVDDDSFILRDTGQRELLFTDPQVIAVLASPPYYEGINEDGDGGTSFGYSKGSGEGSSDTFGFSVGVSVGTQWSAPFGIASAEFELSVTSSFSWAQSESVEISESWGWNDPIAQDLVVFTAIPFDVYYYEVLKSPPGEEAQPGDMMTINVPRKPQPYHMSLPDYNARVTEEHRVTVNHTLGVPGSYFTPEGRDQQKNAASSRGLFSTNTQMSAGSGGGSTTINIEKVKTTEDSFSFDLETKIESKFGVGGVTVGASAGFNYGYGTTSSVSEGTYIEGTVPAIPTADYTLARDFMWGLMAYPKIEPYQKYIFVTYWTKFNN